MTNEAAVQQWREKWDDALGEAILVNLTITQWFPYAAMTADRLAKIGVDTESDDAKAAVKSVLHGGRIDLVASRFYRPIQAAAQRMRIALDRHAHQVLWGRLIGPNAFAQWQEEHDAHKVDFDFAVGRLIANLDVALAEAEDHYRALFSDAWVRLNRVIRDDIPPLDEFVESAIEDLRKEVPSVDVIRDKHTVSVEFDYAPTSSEISEKEELAAERREGFLRSASQQDEARQQILTQMRREVAQQVEARRRTVEASLQAAERAFYQKVIGIVDNLQSGLKERKGKLLGRGATQIKSLIQQAKSLNIFDDADLSQRIGALEDAAVNHLAANDKEGATLANLQDRLADVARHAQVSIEALPKAQVRRSLEIADDVEAPSSVQRRQAADVDVPDAPDSPTTRRAIAAVA